MKCIPLLASSMVHVPALTFLVHTDNLQTHFKKYGEIIDAVIMKDRSTGHPRGFGFVTFANPSVCDLVVLDKHVIDGRTVSDISSILMVCRWLCSYYYLFS